MKFTEEQLTKEYIIKDFTINGEAVTISRADYENMPCAMCTEDFTDEDMQELADFISEGLSQYNFDKQSPYYEDDKDDAFWTEMENSAVIKGMVYYEDIEDPNESDDEE